MRLSKAPRAWLLPHGASVGMALGITALDQGVKAWVLEQVRQGRFLAPEPMLGGLLHFRYAENTGGAFGVLGSGETVGWPLMLISILAFVFIGWYYWTYRDHPGIRLALCLITGGAMGNFLDRLVRSYVVDYIDVDIGSYQWPYFNLADVFITSGAVLLLLLLFWERRRPPEPTKDEPGP